MCQVHWPELFKSSKWRVFKIESDHLELVNGERGDFQESFVEIIVLTLNEIDVRVTQALLNSEL